MFNRTNSTGLTPLLALILFSLLAAACTGAPPLEVEATAPPELQVTPETGVAIVITNAATLRAAPRVDAERLGTLTRDTVVELLGKSADGEFRLVKVAFESGSTVEGFIGTEFLAFVTPTPPGAAPPDAAPDTPTPTNTPGGVPAPDTPTPTNTPSGPDTPTPTNTPSGPDTPTPTNTPSGPDTPTPTNTPSGPDTPTPTNTPSGPDTPTPTNTPSGPVDTPTPTSTPGDSGTPEPLQFTVNVSWALDPYNDEEAIATVTINAIGGWEPYAYYRDGIEQAGAIFEYNWSVCKGNPVTFSVTSADGQNVSEVRFETPPCPATPVP